jgi:translation initiation factor 1
MDGVIRIRREVKGRGGKTVTVISGFQLDDDGLKQLAGELKRSCGAGGSVAKCLRSDRAISAWAGSA